MIGRRGDAASTTGAMRTAVGIFLTMTRFVRIPLVVAIGVSVACDSRSATPQRAADTTTRPQIPSSAGVSPPSAPSGQAAQRAESTTTIRPPVVDSAITPADVVRGYYAAIGDRRYDDAYALWSQDGAASGKTRASFAAGFAQTAKVSVTVGDSIHMEGAAGSQYTTVPVTVVATQTTGAIQRFTGTYTLRRSMVDGATPAQRSWHISAANLKADNR